MYIDFQYVSLPLSLFSFFLFVSRFSIFLPFPLSIFSSSFFVRLSVSLFVYISLSLSIYLSFALLSRDLSNTVRAKSD